MRNNKLESLSGLKNLINLKELYASKNKITDFNELISI